VIFANAGTARFGALGTITEEFFDSLFGANVKGLLFTVQKALPLIAARRCDCAECIRWRLQGPSR